MNSDGRDLKTDTHPQLNLEASGVLLEIAADLLKLLVNHDYTAPSVLSTEPRYYLYLYTAQLTLRN